MSPTDVVDKLLTAGHERPTDDEQHAGYHRQIELHPPNRTATKLTYQPGSEAGAGAFINDTLPQETGCGPRELDPRTPTARNRR